MLEQEASNYSNNTLPVLAGRSLFDSELTPGSSSLIYYLLYISFEGPRVSFSVLVGSAEIILYFFILNRDPLV